MLDTLWKQTELTKESDTPYWELFHESSKTGNYANPLTNEEVIERMENIHESFPYKNFPNIELPDTFATIDGSFMEAIINRKTPKEINPKEISLEELRTILYCAYGVTRDNKDNEYVKRALRTTPSGGALYPLELFFYSNGKIKGLKPGLYHYSPLENSIQLIREGNLEDEIAEALVSFQTHLAYDTSLLIFITAVFNRSTFKYREKGYRFCFIEAGHVAQNINLAATALDFGVINIAGYYDRLMDRFLKIDGLNHSTIYMNGICK